MTKKITTKQRKALQIVAGSGREGVSEQLMAMHGFNQAFLADLCLDGLLTCRENRMAAGGRELRVSRVFISDSGRELLSCKSQDST
jgi:hypothetical protein